MSHSFIVLSYDPDFDPKILGINAASAALAISGLPFDGPVAGIRVGLMDDKLNLYMKNIELDWSDNETDLNLVFSAKKEGIKYYMPNDRCTGNISKKGWV